MPKKYNHLNEEWMKLRESVLTRKRSMKRLEKIGRSEGDYLTPEAEEFLRITGDPVLFAQANPQHLRDLAKVRKGRRDKKSEKPARPSKSGAKERVELLQGLSPLSSVEPSEDGEGSGMVDLTSGYGIPNDAEEIEWAGKFRTKVPFACPEDDPKENILNEYAEHVKTLAQGCLPAEECPWATHFHAKDHDIEDLPVLIRSAMSGGNTVVLRGFSDTRIEMKFEDVIKKCGILKTKEYEAIDAVIRTKALREPHVRMNMERFCQGIEDPTECLCILDCQQSTPDIPDFMRNLDDGYTAWRNLPPHVFLDRDQPVDVTRSQSWILFHHAGFYTFVHYDAEGTSTWTRIDSGYKFWILHRPKEGFEYATTRHEVQKSVEESTVVDGKLRGGSFYGGISTRYVIFGQPGDYILQPPFTLHSVYTPTPSVTSGGHFFSYGTLHLTEMARYFSLQTGMYLTNQVHLSAMPTIFRMIACICYYPDLEYCEKAVAAMCRMVLFQGDYVEKEAMEKKRFDDENFARKICKIISTTLVLRMEIVKKKSPGATSKSSSKRKMPDDYMFRGKWMDPGDRVDIKELLAQMLSWEFT